MRQAAGRPAGRLAARKHVWVLYADKSIVFYLVALRERWDWTVEFVSDDQAAQWTTRQRSTELRSISIHLFQVICPGYF